MLVHVTKGNLNYKPDCPEDPYDCKTIVRLTLGEINEYRVDKTL